jgi:hypothetical protein
LSTHYTYTGHTFWFRWTKFNDSPREKCLSYKHPFSPILAAAAEGLSPQTHDCWSTFRELELVSHNRRLHHYILSTSCFNSLSRTLILLHEVVLSGGSIIAQFPCFRYSLIICVCCYRVIDLFRVLKENYLNVC